MFTNLKSSLFINRQYQSMWLSVLFCAVALGVHAMEWTSGDLVIPAGETLTVTELGRTNSSVTVHGTFMINLGGGNRDYTILTSPMTTATTSHLAPDPGDAAVWKVGRSRVYGYTSNAPRADLVIGDNGGGNGLFHLGCFDPVGNVTSVAWFRYITLSANAQTAADDFRPILLDSFATLMCQRLINANAKPLYVTFTNQWKVGEIYYKDVSGAMQAFWGASLFSPRVPGGDIVLLGRPDAPVVIKGWSQQGFYLLDGTASNRKASVRFEGDCEVMFNMARSWCIFNATNVTYNHSRDTRFMFSSPYGGYVRTLVADVLPWGPETGNLVVETVGDGSTAEKNLDLHGYSQKLNGLVVRGEAHLVNTNAPVTLTFGTGGTDGKLGGSVTNETIVCEKVGAGTLALEAADVWSLTATNGGTIAVASGSNHVHSLTLANVKLSFCDGAILTADEWHVGGGMVVSLDSSCATNVVYLSFPDAPLRYVKEGGNFVTYATPADARGNDLVVRGGTLRFGGAACTNTWWRFIVTKASADKALYTSTEAPDFSREITLGLGVMGMFAADGRYAFENFSNAVSGTAAASLAEGKVATTRPWMRWNKTIMTNLFPSATKEPILVGGDGSAGPARFVHQSADYFKGANRYDIRGTSGTDTWVSSWPNGILFTNGVVSAEQPETVTWRAKASWGRAPASYAIQRIVNRSEKTTFPHPKDWILESSPDGIVWEKMDERAGQTFTTLNEPPYLSEQFNYTFNAHVPYLFSAKNAAWTFTTFGTVEVADGAVLDLSEIPMTNIAFNALAVDCAGAGTITRFRPAAAGTLYVTSSAATRREEGRLVSTVVLPLTLGETDDMSRLADWNVVVDGRPSRESLAACENGNLVIHTYTGTLMIFR